MNVGPGAAVTLRKLVQGGLCRWARLVAMCCPQELWREGGALDDPAVTKLHDVRDWEEADHVDQHLKSKS